MNTSKLLYVVFFFTSYQTSVNRMKTKLCDGQIERVTHSLFSSFLPQWPLERRPEIPPPPSSWHSPQHRLVVVSRWMKSAVANVDAVVAAAAGIAVRTEKVSKERRCSMGV